MGEKKNEGDQDGPEPVKADTRKDKIIEQDPNDIPHKDESQIPDINPGKVQPGHRDREQV